MCHDMLRAPFTAGHVCEAVKRLYSGKVVFHDGTGPASSARKLSQPAGFVLRIGGAAIGLNVDAGRERQAFESREVIRRKETRRIVALSPKRAGGASGASQR